MQPFTLQHVSDNKSAIAAMVSVQNSRFIAGGTNLLDLMKVNVERPAQLIDITSLPLQKIETLPGNVVRIGALVRNSDLAHDPVIEKRFPALSQALLSGASAQLRNMASVGGNLMQRVRCPYFYNVSFPCNKREPGSGCSALNGFNRMHAILGTSDKCIATHPSDMAVPLVALDASVIVQGPKGERTIPIRDFHLLPGNTPQKETALDNGELITAVELPDVPFASRSLYLKVRDRSSYEFALASAAVALDVRNGKINQVRMALGGVGTRPWRAVKAEAILTGSAPDEKTFKAAADAELKDAKPYKYNSFKIELAKRTIVRALTTAGGMS